MESIVHLVWTVAWSRANALRSAEIDIRIDYVFII